MTTVQQKYRSNKTQQQKLKILSDSICDRIEELFDYFDLEYKNSGKLYTMCCPIHEGDHPSALNIYPEGEVSRGNWACRTHNCEKIFKSSIIGFIRGILSNKEKAWQKDGDESCSFKDTIAFCEKFVGTKLDNIKVNQQKQNKAKFNAMIQNIQTQQNTAIQQVTRDHVRQTLQIPSQYFIERGFSQEILDKYDVGLCTNPNKDMYNRVVVPVYDLHYKHLVGCTGRSIFLKCDTCSGYHANNTECPDKKDIYKFSKWKHNNGFKTQESLYNLWFANDYIKRDGYAIIVESPGNVWKLEENDIHHSVAIFGTNLSDNQKLLLDASGAMTLFIITDNDDAGKKAAINIIEKCNRTYQIHVPSITKPDIAEMTSEEIQSQIKDSIKENI